MKPFLIFTAVAGGVLCFVMAWKTALTHEIPATFVYVMAMAGCGLLLNYARKLRE